MGKTRPREAFPRAPLGSEFNYDALPRTPAFFFFFRVRCWGYNGTAAQEVSNEIPLLSKYCGGIPPQLY